MAAYYNEIDPYAAEWLRNLIKRGLIADGTVDERSIADVAPADLAGFTQCHFFAGIGGWSLALRLAEWPDQNPVWTGSCPCQPFSAAGKGAGFADERHLWPHQYRLIEARRPPVWFGEQVASPAGLAWLDSVQSDLERSGYAVSAHDICAASVGAPHIRQRLWIVADAMHSGRPEGWAGAGNGQIAGERGISGLGHSEHSRLERLAGNGDDGDQPGRVGTLTSRPVAATGNVSGLADAERGGRQQQQSNGPASLFDETNGGRLLQSRDNSSGLGSEPATRPTHSPWADADWLYCRDGKWRPVEPGTFPLAHGVSGRVGRLRAYGNAIVPQVAAEVISAYLDDERGVGA